MLAGAACREAGSALSGGPAHAPAHSHGGGGDHGHLPVDLNLRAAYVHVAADAATSLLAIGALAGSSTCI